MVVFWMTLLLSIHTYTKSLLRMFLVWLEYSPMCAPRCNLKWFRSDTAWPLICGFGEPGLQWLAGEYNGFLPASSTLLPLLMLNIGMSGICFLLHPDEGSGHYLFGWNWKNASAGESQFYWCFADIFGILAFYHFLYSFEMQIRRSELILSLASRASLVFC